MLQIPDFIQDKFSSYTSESNSGYTFIDNVYITEATVNGLIQFFQANFFSAYGKLVFIKDSYLFDDFSPDKKLRYHISLRYNNAVARGNTDRTLIKESIKLNKHFKIKTNTAEPVLKLQKGNVDHKVFLTLLLEDDDTLTKLKDDSVANLHISIAHFYFATSNDEKINEMIDSVNASLSDLDETLLQKLLELLSQTNTELAQLNGLEKTLVTC